MSVIVTVLFKGDPQKLESVAAENPDRMTGILDRAKSHGLIAHRFYGSDSGEIIAIDEWPDAESFQRFFSDAQDEIGPMMSEVGVTEEPEPTFWRKLETNDEVGWDA